MADLIDRKKLIEWLSPYIHYDENISPETVIEDIKAAPSVDAVPVVRCKDCIRRYDTDECPMCYVSEGRYYEYTSGNDYCSHGERKYNETD